MTRTLFAAALGLGALAPGALGSVLPPVAATTVGRVVTSPLISDLDGDGRSDILLTRGTGEAFRDFPNRELVAIPARGRIFDAPLVSRVGSDPARVELRTDERVLLGDVGGDGQIDAVTCIADFGASAVTRSMIGVSRGRGNGRFDPPAAAGGESGFLSCLALSDVDGDRNLDVVALRTDVPQRSRVVVLRGDGRGAFASAEVVTELTGAGERAWAVADTDGDGRREVIERSSEWLGTVGADTITVHRRADGAWRAVGTVSVPSRSFLRPTLAVGDLNGDGRADVATPASSTVARRAALFTALANPDGRLAEPRSVASIDPSTDLAMGDVTGDGRTDLVAVRLAPAFPPRTLYVLQGDGAGGFGVTEAIPSTLTRPTIADLDGDHRNDVVGDCGGRLCVAWGRPPGAHRRGPACLPPDLGAGDDFTRRLGDSEGPRRRAGPRDSHASASGRSLRDLAPTSAGHRQRHRHAHHRRERPDREPALARGARPMTRAMLILMGALLVPGVAAADSTRCTVDSGRGGSDSAGLQSLALDASGRAVTTWSRSESEVPGPLSVAWWNGRWTHRSIARTAQYSFTAVSGSAATIDRGRLTTLVTRPDALGVALEITRPGSLDLLPAETLASGPEIRQPRLAASPSGHMLVTWIEGRTVLVRLRAPSGAWSDAEVVTTDAARALHAAITASGAAVLAWTDRSSQRPVIATLPAPGRGWAPPSDRSPRLGRDQARGRRRREVRGRSELPAGRSRLHRRRPDRSVPARADAVDVSRPVRGQPRWPGGERHELVRVSHTPVRRHPLRPQLRAPAGRCRLLRGRRRSRSDHRRGGRPRLG